MDDYPPPMSVRVSKRWLGLSAALLLLGMLGSLGGVVAVVLRELQATRSEMVRLRDLAHRQEVELGALEQRLGEVGRAVVDVRSLEAEARKRLLGEIEARTGSQAEEVRAQLEDLEGRLSKLREAADEHARLLAAAHADEDVEVRYRELMSPTVRVNARHEVGSGTILWSRAVGERARTFVLTAWHIVSDNAAGAQETPLEIDFYEAGELLRTELGRIVARDERLDLALVEVKGYHVYERQARILSVEQLAQLPMFSKVYAIGCPLGYSPLPTSGELTSKEKELDGNTYWMINAPTIFGNSGGGIYHADSRAMIGVLSRISAYKNMIDVAVPHMGLVTPMEQVYAWLDETRYGFTYRDRLAEAHPAGHEQKRDAKPVTASASQGR